MAEFNISYNKSMSHEGQYSNDPRDLGGETWKGISRRNFPDWEGWTIVDAIKLNVQASALSKTMNADDELEELVLKFYQSEFWDKLRLSEINEQLIADELFDTAINQGKPTAVKQFQTALNLLNNNEKHYSDIVNDGKIGDNTMKAYRAYMLTSNFPGRSIERNTSVILKVMNGLQFARYAEIATDNPNQEIYFYGWINRV